MQNENKILAFICIFALSFGYIGWFFAEQDNELLRQELVSIKYNNVGGDYAHPQH